VGSHHIEPGSLPIHEHAEPQQPLQPALLQVSM
jgi:hypothetical protein